MARQAIPNSVDFYVDAAADLTASIDDARLADGARTWVRGAGAEHGLWCLDQTSALPIGPGVVATQSGTGRWIYFGPGFSPPPPPGAGSPYEFVYQPGGVASGNVYNSWPLLVAAAAAFPGTKLVYFDATLAPCSIPTGVWDFASPTDFSGSIGAPTPSPTPLTIDDGAVLRNVFDFDSIAITSNSKSAVIVSPLPGARYTLSGSTTVQQTDPAGEFIRSSTGFVFSPVTVILRDDARILTGGGQAIRVTAFGAFVDVYALDDSVVQPNTIAAAVGSFAAGYTVDSASLSANQPAVLPGGVLPVTLLSIAARVAYDDTLVLPPLGATNVQAAIDALKGGVGGGSPYEYVFRPGGAASGNVYTSWAALVAAAMLFPGAKIVYFDDSIAPCAIPPGAWTFVGATTFEGKPSVPGAGTPLTVTDGVKLNGVQAFYGLTIDSQTTDPTGVIDAPAGPVGVCVLERDTKITQTGAGGTFLRVNQPNQVFVFSVAEGSIVATGPGPDPVVSLTEPTLSSTLIVAAAQSGAIVEQDTVAAIAGSTISGIVVDPSCSIDPNQIDVLPGGVLTVDLAAIGARVKYDDTLVLPPLGATNVQAAIDALKALVGSVSEQVDDFTAAAAQTVFILTQTPTSAPDVELHVNGVEYQNGVDFTVVGTTATWLNVPFVLNGDLVSFRYSY